MIKVTNIHKAFGSNQVLKGIDLTINKGKVVVILGTFRIREDYFFTLS